MRITHFPQMLELVHGIDRILIGRTAAAVDLVEVPDGETTIVRLPTWSMLKPAIDVGLKAVKNKNLVLPARIQWSCPPLVFLDRDATTQVSWRITNMGHRLSGQIELTRDGQSEEIPGQVGGSVDVAFSKRDLGRRIQKLATDGDVARWQVVQSFEEYTRSKIAEASKQLAREFSEYHGRSIPAVLDEQRVDALLTHMLFGKGDSSIVGRMVEQALDPVAFDKFDPGRYFSLNLKRSALGEVRRVIGDPHIGSKVRRIHAKANVSSLEELVEVYNEYYPNEHLGAKRAAAALTAGHFPEVFAEGLPDSELRDFADRRIGGGI
ncbi:hypothetical protein [Agromyces humi]|uniref:hypothetical protein n=1 Tax=Agromyces humi TaxID=1766800 RepID=UPI001357B808|nr:hypothetical protein [Agromyces humi]